MDGIEMLTNSVFGNLMVEVAESIAYDLNREFIVLVRNEELFRILKKMLLLKWQEPLERMEPRVILMERFLCFTRD